jgi:rhodanese-related sulfurtransferase
MYLIPHNLNYFFDRQKRLSYCRTGSRSAQVCLYFELARFKQSYQSSEQYCSMDNEQAENRLLNT